MPYFQTALLLGAGASVAAGISNSPNLTADIAAELKRAENARLLSCWNHVYDAVLTLSPTPDIERIYNALSFGLDYVGAPAEPFLNYDHQFLVWRNDGQENKETIVRLLQFIRRQRARVTWQSIIWIGDKAVCWFGAIKASLLGGTTLSLTKQELKNAGF